MPPDRSLLADSAGACLETRIVSKRSSLSIIGPGLSYPDGNQASFTSNSLEASFTSAYSTMLSSGRNRGNFLHPCGKRGSPELTSPFNPSPPFLPIRLSVVRHETRRRTVPSRTQAPCISSCEFILQPQQHVKASQDLWSSCEKISSCSLWLWQTPQSCVCFNAGHSADSTGVSQDDVSDFSASIVWISKPAATQGKT